MNIERLRSFGPVAPPGARVLILGSMPGAESLRRRQYYAHPKNSFWDFMGELFGAGRELPYRKRLARLRACRVALWDVAGECEREGSLDAAIDHRSVRPNDFARLFRRCPGIRAVFFNGRTPAELFRRFVEPELADRLAGVRFVVLPSTSPANAGVSRRGKRAQWRRVLDALSDGDPIRRTARSSSGISIGGRGARRSLRIPIGPTTALWKGRGAGLGARGRERCFHWRPG